MTSMSIGHLHAQPPSLLRLKTVGLTSHHSDKLYYGQTDQPTEMCKAIYPLSFEWGYTNNDEKITDTDNVNDTLTRVLILDDVIMELTITCIW